MVPSNRFRFLRPTSRFLRPTSRFLRVSRRNRDPFPRNRLSCGEWCGLLAGWVVNYGLAVQITRCHTIDACKEGMQCMHAMNGYN